MIERLQYGLTDAGKINILLPNTIIDQAQEKDPSLTDRLREYQDRRFIQLINEDQGSRLSLSLGELGKVPIIKRYDVTEGVTDVISTLICRVPQPEEADERLRFSSFYPTNEYSDFAFYADIQLPDADPDLVVPFVLQAMTDAQRAMKLYGHEGKYGRSTKVNYSQTRGVDLSLSGNSSVHTMGESYRPGMRRVEIDGNNVERYGEPLVYLMGVVALAHADEYV